MTLTAVTKSLARKVLPRRLIEFGKRMRKLSRHHPPVGGVRFGHFKRLTPLSRCYGYDRGRPIDRYYIEKFLQSESACIRGHVLEIGEDTYTRQFGDGVSKADVLHVSKDAVGATYVDDLSDGATLPSNEFDCVILTQTLHLIYDMKAALATVHRILKPGGTLLATVPGITQISDQEWRDSWYWSLTSASATRLCTEVFAPQAVEVNAFGNVLAATSFLQGLADSELTKAELDYFDADYPVTVTMKCRTAHEAPEEKRPRAAGAY